MFFAGPRKRMKKEHDRNMTSGMWDVDQWLVKLLDGQATRNTRATTTVYSGYQLTIHPFQTYSVLIGTSIRFVGTGAKQLYVYINILYIHFIYTCIKLY